MFFKKESGASGVITVFLSLILVPMLALGCLVMEAGRYYSAYTALEEAQYTASMYMLADYNPYMQERFGLLGTNTNLSSKDKENRFQSVLKYNSDNSDADVKAGSLQFVINDIEFSEIYTLSTYQVLKRQILEDAKYSVPYTLLSEKLDLEGIFGKIVDKITAPIGKAEEAVDKVQNFVDQVTNKTNSTASAMKEVLISLSDLETLSLTACNFFTDSGAEYDSYKDFTPELIDEKAYWWEAPKTCPADETYNSKYNAFLNAVNDKIRFMQENENPAGKLQNAQNEQRSNGTKTGTLAIERLEKLLALYLFEQSNRNNPDVDLLKAKQKIKYYYSDYNNEDGTVSKIDAVKEKTYKVNSCIDVFFPGRNINTMDDLSDAVNDLKKTNQYQSISEVEQVLKDFQSDNTKIDATNDAVHELEQEQIWYNNQINEKNRQIEIARVEYLSALSDGKTELKKVHDKIDDVNEKLDAARRAYENLREELKNTGGEQEDSIHGKITALEDQLSDKYNDLARYDQYIVTASLTLNDFKANELNENSSFSERTGMYYWNDRLIAPKPETLRATLLTDFSKIQDLCRAEVMDGESDGFDFESNSGSITVGNFDIKKLWSAFKTLTEKLNPDPYTYNEHLIMVLDGTTTGLLPTIDEIEDEEFSDDKTYVEALLRDAGETLGDGNAIGDDENSAFADDLETFHSSLEELKKRGEDLKKLKLAKFLIEFFAGDPSTASLIKDLFDSLGRMLGNFKAFISYLASQITYGLLINTYITQHFSDRQSVSETGTYYPQDTESGTEGASYFSGATVEYLFKGDADEKVNQTSVFWTIFGIRAIINAIQIAMTEETMSLISSCNIAAPLVYIIAVYYETNIDMNMLLRLSQPVPLWKAHVHLSAAGLKDLLKDIAPEEYLESLDGTMVRVTKTNKGYCYHVDRDKGCRTMIRTERNRAVQRMSVTQARANGYRPCRVCKPDEQVNDAANNSNDIGSMTYSDYLWWMLNFIGSKTKLERVANLIQMEVRYYEHEEYGSTNFQIKDAATYVRSDVKASYHSLLPMFSLGSNTSTGFAKMHSLKFSGY